MAHKATASMKYGGYKFANSFKLRLRGFKEEMPSKEEIVKTWLAANTSAKTVENHRADFAALKKNLDPNDCKAFLAQPQGTRNRYRDVVCLDASRVKLKGVENDYIHANYVSTPQDENRFICTQGPTDSSCTDFWQMIWQEKAGVIIMLCNFTEKSVKKCAEYFPIGAGKSVSFGKFKINCTSRAENMKYEYFPNFCAVKIAVSNLTVCKDKEKMEVQHFHWMDWPDRGAPKGDLSAISLLLQVNRTKKPIVVHCSAGIGRTGSIVMLEYIYELFESGKDCEKLDQILAKIREQRALSIQNDLQYLYVIRVMLEFFVRTTPLTAQQVEDVKKFLADYRQLTGE
ncbi:unnamed protein product [Bursaphelenchus xylophilus]|uniref:(pine wood nematode) hypothetical protein n=1 Tax=Bursaphelenchus xylophilus TaxID=6326 RepID=A0A7I8X0V0_BURXY|nr:unnamed protein product [Bursaphelenchus xylophilus]CAG9129886.1 unnamed protein product [Bursaphelenchus xylophilus]